MIQRKDDRLWGGRFAEPPNQAFDAFQRSFAFDRRLLPYELLVDREWANALEVAGILQSKEAQEIIAALDRIAERAIRDQAWLDHSTAEDVHHFVEKALVEDLGHLGWKLHTGRSRNELVATDFRLFVMNACGEIQDALLELMDSLAVQAENYLDIPMAGMTHLQHAQPILLSHFLLAHAEAFTRDLSRLRSAAVSADSCPMGSGALAGCSLPIDRQAIAAALGFTRITANSLDAVGDRDFALDFLFALSGIATHLSRLAEDFILFASQEFSYVALSDEYSTGSSLMPQKKNPDSFELIRGKTGRVTAALTALLTTLKGLPSGYQRDLQEDKEALFTAFDQTCAMLGVAAGAVRTATFHEGKFRAMASDTALLATEAADYLVSRGQPFRQAHDLVGQLLREAERLGKTWTQLTLPELKRISPLLAADFFDVLTLESALATKKVPGGTAPESVRSALTDLKSRLANLKSSKSGEQNEKPARQSQ